MGDHVCPFWVGYILACPVRRLGQSPEKILAPHVAEAMTVLDVGCAMGFFSLPLARMVGPGGRVICVDLQERMIAALRSRARKAGLEGRIDARVCGSESLGVEDCAGSVDFALAFAVAHEVPSTGSLMAEICGVLREAGRLLLAEPMGHVGKDEFEATVSLAQSRGMAVVERPKIWRSHAALLARR